MKGGVSAVPKALRNSLAALAILTGAAGGTYYAVEVQREAQENTYLQAVAADPDTSQAVKIAMVMGYFYESGNKHIGTPYVDKVGRGQPLTVCNGITGAVVIADKTYTPIECYKLEKRRYVALEKHMPSLLNRWDEYGDFTRATFLDFGWNKGEGALTSSTMRRKANAGDLAGACAENPRWNKGTVKGILTVLPGLESRARSNAEICMPGFEL